jgi:hypothetical protein
MPEVLHKTILKTEEIINSHLKELERSLSRAVEKQIIPSQLEMSDILLKLIKESQGDYNGPRFPDHFLTFQLDKLSANLTL